MNIIFVICIIWASNAVISKAEDPEEIEGSDDEYKEEQVIFYFDQQKMNIYIVFVIIVYHNIWTSNDFITKSDYSEGTDDSAGGKEYYETIFDSEEGVYI